MSSIFDILHKNFQEDQFTGVVDTLIKYKTAQQMREPAIGCGSCRLWLFTTAGWRSTVAVIRCGTRTPTDLPPFCHGCRGGCRFFNYGGLHSSTVPFRWRTLGLNISTSSRDTFNVVSINSLSGPILMASNSLLLKQSACTFADSVKHI